MWGLRTAAHSVCAIPASRISGSRAVRCQPDYTTKEMPHGSIQDQHVLADRRDLLEPSPDVRRAINGARERETQERRQCLPWRPSPSTWTWLVMEWSRFARTPECRPLRSRPGRCHQMAMSAAIREAIADATKEGKLRPNAVDSLTGKNSGNNLGEGAPVIHFEQWEKDEVEVRLILKGGGCENKSIQYSLPAELPYLGRADRNIDGVRNASCTQCGRHRVMVAASVQSAWQSAETGRPAITMPKSSSSERSMTSIRFPIWRSWNNTSWTSQHAGNRTMDSGKGNPDRLQDRSISPAPASFFVSVAYDCWAFRRLGVVLDPSTGAIRRWLYKEDTRL